MRPLRSDDRDWLVSEHISFYRASNGFDDSFGVLVGKIIDDFLAGHDAACEAAWVAACGGAPVGSIFCVRLDAETAQLRLFFVAPEYRGRGSGRLLLDTCMSFARTHGYRGMRLWTHQSHTEACTLYRHVGWCRIAAEPQLSFGQPEVVETYVYEF